MAGRKKQSTEVAVRNIRRRTRRKFLPKEKIRIALKGLRGEQSVSKLCRREGIAADLYYRWSRDFLEADKKQPAGDTVRGQHVRHRRLRIRDGNHGDDRRRGRNRDLGGNRYARAA